MWTNFLSRGDRKRLDKARDAASAARDLAQLAHGWAKGVVTAARRPPTTAFVPAPRFPLPSAPAGTRATGLSALRRPPAPIGREETMRRLTQQLTIDALDHEKSARDWDRAARRNDPFVAGGPDVHQQMLAVATGKATTWVDVRSAVEAYRRSEREWDAAQGKWTDILFLWRQTTHH